MSERYSKLFALPARTYAMGTAVVIIAGALLKDNQTGKVLVQLKIQNISNRSIKAVTAKIVPLDTVGNPLGETVDYQYLDLNVAWDMEFGQKIPVVLPNASTREIKVYISDVIFTDNTVWSTSGELWEQLPAP